MAGYFSSHRSILFIPPMHYNGCQRDMERFLDARAKELVVGGVMVLIMLCIPDGIPNSRILSGFMLDLLASSLMDMAKKNSKCTIMIKLPMISIPCQYFAAGVPGSFYGRLFPESSPNLVHSSYALQWLSKVPEEVLDKNSLAWNKGRVYYTNAAEDHVRKAYAAQFAKDMGRFLDARAKELVVGGMMVLIMGSVPDGIPNSQTPPGLMFDLLGSSLMDMAERASASLLDAKISEVITKKLDIKNLCSNSNTLRIADLGCSVGPNTFIAKHNVLEAMKHKYQTECPAFELPEFQVFYNDHASNDFNTLFASLPPEKQYFAAGVPG
ncbi:hypothetical protein PTKIN_Ptkin02bG0039800 [Pterospermum kingtungense]